MAARISEQDFEEKVKQAEGLILVDFYTDSCIACKQLSPTLGDIEEEYEGKTAVYKVNAGYDGQLAEEYQVISAPTLLLFRDGEVLDRKTGVQTKTVLSQWLDGYLE